MEKWCFDLDIGGYVDPYNWILKIESEVSYKTKVGCAERERDRRVISTLNVCSIAKCKYLLRIMERKQL